MNSVELPASLLRFLSSFFKNLQQATWVPLSGGSINEVYLLCTAQEKILIKLNRSDSAAGILASEAEGLKALAPYLPVPNVIGIEHAAGVSMLVLTYYPVSSSNEAQWHACGAALARMHVQPAAFFGWTSDNYLGSLVQENAPCTDAASFLITRRIQPLLRQARNRSLISPGLVKEIEQTYVRIESLFHSEKPSLVHGDLWTGNVLETASGIVFIDPSVHYGVPASDLVMSRLFGHFPDSFYQGYQAMLPFNSDQESKEHVASLVPLLLHLNLFGTGYLASIKSRLKNLQG